LRVEGELLKSIGMINDYTIDLKGTNHSMTPEGELTYDSVITMSVVPKKVLSHICVDFTVTPTGVEFN
jgi:hypothetical protein